MKCIRGLREQDASARKGLYCAWDCKVSGHFPSSRNLETKFRGFCLTRPQVLVDRHVRGWALIARGICYRSLDNLVSAIYLKYVIFVAEKSKCSCSMVSVYMILIVLLNK
jgi:hypothetical protein